MGFTKINVLFQITKLGHIKFKSFVQKHVNNKVQEWVSNASNKNKGLEMVQ